MLHSVVALKCTLVARCDSIVYMFISSASLCVHAHAYIRVCVYFASAAVCGVRCSSCYSEAFNGCAEASVE